MSTTTENALCSHAAHHGYRLIKSRRDGSYGLTDASTNSVAITPLANDGCCHTLDDIAEHLEQLTG